MKGRKRLRAGKKHEKHGPDGMIQVSLSLTPKEYDWLVARPEGMNVTVRYLILQAIGSEEIAGKKQILEKLFVASLPSPEEQAIPWVYLLPQG